MLGFQDDQDASRSQIPPFKRDIINMYKYIQIPSNTKNLIHPDVKLARAVPVGSEIGEKCPIFIQVVT